MEFHYNNETLRKAQLVQLEILIEFDRICKANNLNYQLFSGTLLGAIRHKGFIPWDDDIDVVMIRSDYDRLQEICSKQLDSKYFLQNYNTDPKFFRQFSRLRKNNTKYVQNAYQNIDMHHGIFIDIFPLDNVIPNSIKEYMRCKILLVLGRLNRFRNRGLSNYPNILKGIIWKSAVILSNIIVKKPTFDRIKTRITKMFENKDTDFLNHLTNGTTQVRFKRFLMKKEDFYDVIDWEFEGRSFPIARNYHQILYTTYGDYMKLPPKEQQQPHHGIIELVIEGVDK